MSPLLFGYPSSIILSLKSDLKRLYKDHTPPLKLGFKTYDIQCNLIYQHHPVRNY